MKISKNIIIVVAFILLIITCFYYFGGPSLLGIIDDTNTQNKDLSGMKGFGELLGPNARKGYIVSYLDTGLSETITVTGKVRADLWTTAVISKYKYLIYGKKDQFSDWELLSQPGSTSMFISNPNPGVKTISGIQIGGEKYFAPYEFSFISNDYDAVMAKCQVYIDLNIFNPLDGFQWKTLQIDQAYLYEGWGGLYLPRDEDGRPRSTFEIGETVNIGVETTYGGESVGEGKTWRVVLQEPSDQGGEVVKQQDYGDNVDTTFSFKVTEDMFSTSSSNEYQLKIYNTLIPKGTLLVNTIDILAKAPSDVNFSDTSIQVEIDKKTSLTVTATVNSDTQLAIDHFRVSVIYGTNDVLLPTDPSSDRWIIHTTDVTAQGSGGTYTATIGFTPERESYVTVHAKAVDIDNRASKRTRTFTMWVYDGSPVDEDMIDDETGDGDYAGGHSSNWWPPWDPSGGNWSSEDVTMWIGAILAIVIAGISIIIAIVSGLDPLKKIIIAGVGITIAVAIFYYLFF